METLDAALEECQLENTRVCQAKPAKYRNFTSKDLLERHGVEFPKKPDRSKELHNSKYKCCPSKTPVAGFSRLLPENELEEAEQLEISIRESLRSNSHRRQHSPYTNAAPRMSSDCINEVQEITRSESATISRPNDSVDEPITQIMPNSSADSLTESNATGPSSSCAIDETTTKSTSNVKISEVGEAPDNTRTAAELLLSLASIH